MDHWLLFHSVEHIQLQNYSSTLAVLLNENMCVRASVIAHVGAQNMTHTSAAAASMLT